MAIIVVSTQMGAGGPEIGMALAQKCGYRYVDQELLQDAGRRYGLAEERLSHLDESKPTIFERFDAETRHHITVLQTTLLQLAEPDNAVFMRGGGRPPARRVTRARLARAGGTGDQSRDTAVSDHRRGAGRRRHARGHGRARSRRRSGALSARGERRPHTTTGNTPDSTVCGVGIKE